jgi:hypothetical protein
LQEHLAGHDLEEFYEAYSGLTIKGCRPLTATRLLIQEVLEVPPLLTSVLDLALLLVRYCE